LSFDPLRNGSRRRNVEKNITPQLAGLALASVAVNAAILSLSGGEEDIARTSQIGRS